ncbi:MAG TPA: DNA-formamidopyrimidine glycosylase family protein [Acidobacteriota bacterium]|nr:DNA-formamidopyrimidine glycosylase family protein [Acidobacteriota bacterium]
MPELPDVEGFKRYFEQTSLHKTIEQVQVLAPEMVYWISPQRLKRELKGHSFERAIRHGKYLFAELENKKSLVLHFGMTGFLLHVTNPSDFPSHVRLLLQFAKNDALAFDCLRKLGKISFTENISRFVQEERGLGPDAITLTYKNFHGLLKKRKGRIKPVLMNQSVLAGIGNIWADEILFQSGIHPKTRIDELNPIQIRTMFDVMLNVLNTAIRKQQNESELPRKYLTRSRNNKGACPICKTVFNREQIGGRTTYYCPSCQAFSF